MKNITYHLQKISLTEKQHIFISLSYWGKVCDCQRPSLPLKSCFSNLMDMWKKYRSGERWQTSINVYFFIFSVIINHWIPFCDFFFSFFFPGFEYLILLKYERLWAITFELYVVFLIVMFWASKIFSLWFVLIESETFKETTLFADW